MLPGYIAARLEITAMTAVAAHRLVTANHNRLTRIRRAPRSQSGHYFRASFFRWGEWSMRVLGFSFLMVWLLATAPFAITVADTVQAPDRTQSLPEPVPGLDEAMDLLNLLD